MIGMMMAAQEVLVGLSSPPSPAGFSRICRLSEGLTHFQCKQVGMGLVLAGDLVGAVDILSETRHRSIGGTTPIVSVLELHVHVAKVERPTLPQILTEPKAEEMAIVVGRAGTEVILGLPHLVEGISIAQLGIG